MHLLLVRNGNKPSLFINLDKKHIFLLGFVFLFLIVGGSFSVAKIASKSDAFADLTGLAIEKTETTVISLKDGEHESSPAVLSVLASSVGRLEAKVKQLGIRANQIEEMAGIQSHDEEEHQALSSSQGGPLIESKFDQKEMLEMLNASLKDIQSKVEEKKDHLAQLRDLLVVTQFKEGGISVVIPVDLRKSYRSSGFGRRIDPFTGKGAMHRGVDFSASRGTHIKSVADGVVVFSGRRGAYGNVVDIDHGSGLVTRYGHAKAIFVKVGEIVQKGQKIASVGSTGRSTGPHLHFELLYKGRAINPAKFLAKAR